MGRRLAVLTGKRFVDTDDFFVDRHGVTISGFVADHGWDEFRKQESLILEAVSRDGDSVVATGGGIILKPENVALMKKRGLVVWLTASQETIHKRMTADPASANLRPGLTDHPLKEEIAGTLAERIPLYEKAMTLSIDTEGVAVDDICRRIITATAGKG